MEKHLPVVGWLNIVHSGFALLFGLFVWFLLMGISTIPDVDHEAGTILHIIGFIFAGLMTMVSAPGIIGGIGMLKRQGWSRILLIIVGFLNLAAFPIGTAVGIYTLWVLLREETTQLFARRPTG